MKFDLYKFFYSSDAIVRIDLYDQRCVEVKGTIVEEGDHWWPIERVDSQGLIDLHASFVDYKDQELSELLAEMIDLEVQRIMFPSRLLCNGTTLLADRPRSQVQFSRAFDKTPADTIDAYPELYSKIRASSRLRVAEIPEVAQSVITDYIEETFNFFDDEFSETEPYCFIVQSLGRYKEYYLFNHDGVLVSKSLDIKTIGAAILYTYWIDI